MLDSRNHADPFGQPNVSRVIVGGTIAESSISTAGIARSIDIGNFERRETALMLLDVLSEPNPPNANPLFLNNIQIAPGSTMIDLIGVAVGNIVGTFGRRGRNARIATMHDAWSRREFLKGLGVAAGGCVLGGSGLAACASETPPPGAASAGSASGLLTKPIPATGERIPVIGMGTWLTFDIVPVGGFLDTRVEVLRRFFDAGGAVVDSSPMYGHAERVVGECLRRLENDGGLFSATKVWTPLGWLGERQIEESHELWGERVIDLFQVHNLRAWETHLETLREHREAGRVRYLGATTSHGRRHDEMARVIAEQPFDFVQLTYNLVDREAEDRLLPLAAEHGRAVIVNRPFRGGSLIGDLEGKPLPPWAAEIDCATWPQLLLKFVVSHPAVTCAIPATSDPDHMSENMQAAYGPLPDESMRRRMVRYVEGL